MRTIMKKSVFLSMLVVMLLSMACMMTSCKSCGKGSPGESAVEKVVAASDYDGVLADFTAGVNHIVALHRQTMNQKIGGQQYEWRNLQVIFNDTIKAETIDDLKVVDITDVFFYWNDEEPHVQYISTNVAKGTIIPNPIIDVWIEDDELDNCEIKLWPEDVLKRLKEWNGVIPESKCMVLRMPVGPRNCNAQWVMGDIGDPIFIDAVTGDITNWCPAFPIPNVNGPLGEWP